MSPSSSILAVLLLASVGLVTAQTELFAYGSEWLYWDDGDIADPAWNTVGFDTSAWRSGTAPLGYNSKSLIVATTIRFGGNDANKHITTYFRKTITNAGPDGTEAVLDLGYTVDDAAVVYLNGVEVSRFNLPDGPIEYGTVATTAIANAVYETEWVETGMAVTLLAGDNVLAVEVHQQSKTSSDLVFDARLSAEILPSASTTTTASATPAASPTRTPSPSMEPPGPEQIKYFDPWRYEDTGTDLGTAWREPSYDDSFWRSGDSPLGYGEAWIRTRLSFGPSTSVRHTTYYFRASFDLVKEAGKAYVADFTFQCDDGVVIYMNGQEFHRFNMPELPATITHDTLASSALGGGDETAKRPVQATDDMLVNGVNIIAVELHQASRSSSDVNFLGQLYAHETDAPVPTPSPTPSEAPTPSPTPSPVVSPSPSPTLSPAPAVDPTPSPTPSTAGGGGGGGGDPSPSASPTPAGGATDPTPSASPSVAAASPSPAASPSSAAVVDPSPSPAAADPSPSPSSSAPAHCTCTCATLSCCEEVTPDLEALCSDAGGGPTTDGDGGDDGGLSAGATQGIAWAAAFVLVALGGLGAFLFLRRRRKKAAAEGEKSKDVPEPAAHFPKGSSGPKLAGRKASASRQPRSDVSSEGGSDQSSVGSNKAADNPAPVQSTAVAQQAADAVETKDDDPEDAQPLLEEGDDAETDVTDQFAIVISEPVTPKTSAANKGPATTTPRAPSPVRQKQAAAKKRQQQKQKKAAAQAQAAAAAQAQAQAQAQAAAAAASREQRQQQMLKEQRRRERLAHHQQQERRRQMQAIRAAQQAAQAEQQAGARSRQSLRGMAAAAGGAPRGRRSPMPQMRAQAKAAAMTGGYGGPEVRALARTSPVPDMMGAPVAPPAATRGGRMGRRSGGRRQRGALPGSGQPQPRMRSKSPAPGRRSVSPAMRATSPAPAPMGAIAPASLPPVSDDVINAYLRARGANVTIAQLEAIAKTQPQAPAPVSPAAHATPAMEAAPAAGGGPVFPRFVGSQAEVDGDHLDWERRSPGGQYMAPMAAAPVRRSRSPRARGRSPMRRPASPYDAPAAYGMPAPGPRMAPRVRAVSRSRSPMRRQDVYVPPPRHSYSSEYIPTDQEVMQEWDSVLAESADYIPDSEYEY